MADIDPEYQQLVGAALESALRLAEEERNRSGAELHSGVAQDLTGLIFRLTEIQNSCTDPVAARGLSAGLKQADQILERVRLLSSRASPPMLDEIGLAAGLGWLADYARRHRSMYVQVDARASALERSTTALLFRWARWLVDSLPATSASIRVTEEAQVVALRLEFQTSAPQFPADVAQAETQFILSECVRYAGGVVSIESAPSRILFQISLPTARFAPGTTVLLCDDNAMVRETTAIALAANGLHVLSVATEAEALSLARELLDDIHVLVTNNDDGSRSGVELFAVLRQARKGLRAIFTSAGSEMEYADSPGQITAHIQKPFAPRDLIQAIHRLLQRK